MVHTAPDQGPGLVTQTAPSLIHLNLNNESQYKKIIINITFDPLVILSSSLMNPASASCRPGSS